MVPNLKKHKFYFIYLQASKIKVTEVASVKVRNFNGNTQMI